MKTETSKPKSTVQFEPAPAIHAPQLPRNYRQIRQRAREIYRARGGAPGMALKDWLKAELELKQALEN